jgi:hypothetical protein
MLLPHMKSVGEEKWAAISIVVHLSPFVLGRNAVFAFEN